MRYFISALLICFVFVLSAQNEQSGPWKTLADVSYEQQYSEMLGFDIDVPVFGDNVRALEGQIITLTGYIVPLEGFGAHKEFIFSALPYNMCYFCGGAGPETVMEVFADEAVQYTAEAITLRGQLVLNRDDVNRLMYFLMDAEKI
jgi:hypothetical protein